MARPPRIRGVQTDVTKTALPNMTRERDVRPLSEKIVSNLHQKGFAVFLMCVGTALAVLLPSFAIYFFIIGVFFTWWALTRPEISPIKIPIQENTLDRNELHPANRKPTPGKGIFFIGNDINSGKEVWVTNDDARQHFLVMGTTGAGKTELLLSFSSNALSWGSGFLYVDGKADRSLYAKILVMCRRWGRDDDLLVLNFMTGDNSVMDVGGNGTVNTNTMNPFANGSPDALVQLVTSLMGGGGGDNQMWVDRAQSMFTGMMYGLVWLRDAKGKPLGVGDIRDHLQLRKLITLVDKDVYPDMPEHITKSIKAYLSSLPGWDNDKSPLKSNLEGREAEQITKQHGFLEMQFTKIFSSLVDVYTNIFNTAHGEIDVYDVVLNRRILVVMLPALEKADNELASLGKIIVASMKGMMGSVLGSNLEGGWDQLVENRPTSSPSPFIVIFDEVGYYTVSGMAVMAAQGRSLGFSLVFASQDLNSLKRNEEKEAESIIGNTNLKMLMRTEDKATKELGIEAGGKSEKIQIDGYSMEDSDGWDSTKSAKANMEEVINGTDLKGQDAGYLHMIYKDKTVRARSFYADAPSSLDLGRVKLRPNHFLIIERGDLSEADGLQRQPMLMSLLSAPDFAEQMDDLAAYETEVLREKNMVSPDATIINTLFGRIEAVRGRKDLLPKEAMGGVINVIASISNFVQSSQSKQLNDILSRGKANTVDLDTIDNSVHDYDEQPEGDSYIASVVDNDIVENDIDHKGRNDHAPSFVVDGVEHDILKDKEISRDEADFVSERISSKKKGKNDILTDDVLSRNNSFETIHRQDRHDIDENIDKTAESLRKEGKAISDLHEQVTGERSDSEIHATDINDILADKNKEFNETLASDDIEDNTFEDAPDIVEEHEEEHHEDDTKSSDSDDSGDGAWEETSIVDESIDDIEEIEEHEEEKVEEPKKEEGVKPEKVEDESGDLMDIDVPEEKEGREYLDVSEDEFEDEATKKSEQESGVDDLDDYDSGDEFTDEEPEKKNLDIKKKKEDGKKSDEKEKSESDNKGSDSDSGKDVLEDLFKDV